MMSYRDINDEFAPRLQKQVDLGETGTDILHGELKNLMHECEKQLDLLEKNNEDLSYYNGRMDALTEIYVLTYNLAYAINERTKNRGR